MATFAPMAMDAASRRARDLLLEWLSPEQRNDYMAWGQFNVVSQDGKRIYRVGFNRAPELISVVDEGIFGQGNRRRRMLKEFTNPDGSVQVTGPGSRYCIHMPGVPWEDYILGIAMLLSCTEGEQVFHRIAYW